ncbi:MAG: hypothetical protein QM757_44790 [Paludibaculum sp.]
MPILALLMTGIAVAGFFYLQHQHRKFDAEVHLRVDAAANMKATDVAAWRGERLADAEVLAAGIRHTPLLLRVLHNEATGRSRAGARLV